MMGNETILLSDLCDLIREPVKPGARPDALYLGLEHLASGRLVRIGGGKASEMQSTTSAFQPGDVLYGKLRPYLDKAVLADEAGVCTTELLVLRAKIGINPKFLAAIVHSRSFLEYAVSGTTGVQHPRTSWAHIREFEIPAFIIDEQHQMAKLLWLVHKTADLYSRKHDILDDLFKALLHKLMTGEVRVEDLDLSIIGSSQSQAYRQE